VRSLREPDRSREASPTNKIIGIDTGVEPAVAASTGVVRIPADRDLVIVSGTPA
jgi:hypothetical protein